VGTYLYVGYHLVELKQVMHLLYQRVTNFSTTSH
jgi:hypothetical protein